MENIKGLSLDKAIVCPYLTAVDKRIWITNNTFPELSLRAFHCRRSARTLGMRPSLYLTGISGRGVNSSALRCHSGALQKDNQLQECLVSTNCWKKSTGSIPAPLEDTSLTHLSLRTLLWGRTQLGKLGPALSCSWSRWTRADRHEGGGPWPSATCQMATGNF